MNKERKYIKLSDYARKKGIHYNTAYNHFNQGIIEGAYKDPNTLSIYVPANWDIKKEFKSNHCVIYTRVSSSENKENLTRMYGLRRSRRTTEKLIKTIESEKING